MKEGSGPNINEVHADKGRIHVGHGVKPAATDPNVIFKSVGGPRVRNSLGGKNPQRKWVDQVALVK